MKFDKKLVTANKENISLMFSVEMLRETQFMQSIVNTLKLAYFQQIFGKDDSEYYYIGRAEK